MTDEKNHNHHHDMENDCLEAFDHLYAYLNGEIKDELTLKQVEHHLQHCKSCFTRTQMERELNERMKQSGQKKTPDALKSRLKNLLDDL